MSYKFRRCDNDQIVTVDFEQMMTKDALGCITLKDGVQAREIRESSRSVGRRDEGLASSVNRPIVSDALGFGESQLADFEADRKANGFSGVEFVRDPGVPQFFQVHCNSPEQWQRYVRHRGARDQNSLNGSSATLSKELLERATELAKRR